MRRILMAMLMSVMVMVCGICSAQITEKDLNIGGIYIGQSMDEIVEKYGDSIRRESIPPLTKAFVFVPSLETKKFCGFYINNDSKLTLPSGIGLHMPMDLIFRAYGEPDNYKVTKGNEWGYKDRFHLTYKTTERMIYSDTGSSRPVYDELVFTCDENKKIIRIDGNMLSAVKVEMP